jgi:Domain of unknown function (DUF1772)
MSFDPNNPLIGLDQEKRSKLLISYNVMNTPPGAATAETRRLIGRWGILHAGRSVLGLAATVIFLWARR